jgi:protein arginine N-methyltransferase 1
VPERSLDVDSPSRVDLVVAEVLGNFAYEEGVLETLRDAARFLAPGGTLIPQALTQWAAPVIADRFERNLRSWRSVRARLDLADAEHVTRNNMYVHALEPSDLLDAPPQAWDTLAFNGELTSRREGRVHWDFGAAATIYGFALWWECTLVPGVALSTSPFAPRTHWDQIYLPLLEPIAGLPGDCVELGLVSETGGGESGIAVQWSVTHERSGKALTRQALDIAQGYLG